MENTKKTSDKDQNLKDSKNSLRLHPKQTISNLESKLNRLVKKEVKLVSLIENLNLEIDEQLNSDTPVLESGIWSLKEEVLETEQRLDKVRSKKLKIDGLLVEKRKHNASVRKTRLSKLQVSEQVH